MANLLQSAVSKLDADETNALVAPILAVLKAVAPEGDDGDAAREFCDRYAAALAVHGHELAWVAPNGSSYVDRSVDESGDATLDEVSGFAQRPLQVAGWQQLAAASTNGRLRPGLPTGSGPFGASIYVQSETGATVFILD